MEKRNGVYQGIPVKRYVFNSFVDVFSIQTSHISKNRYKGWRNGWVEVSIGKRKSQSPL